MSVLARVFGLLGESGITPRRVQMLVTDSFAAITGAGYLTQAIVSPDAIYPTDIFDITYAYNSSTGQGKYGQFLPLIGVNGVITLMPANCTTNVGVFTPQLAFGGVTSGIAYSTQTGIYSLIGNAVNFHIVIALISKGAAVGAATITGLPTASRGGYVTVPQLQSVTFAGTPQASIATAGTSLALSVIATGAVLVNLANTDFVNSSIVTVSGNYLI